MTLGKRPTPSWQTVYAERPHATTIGGTQKQTDVMSMSVGGGGAL